MSYGFLATNANGQVLVSSQTRNLHFVGKAPVNRLVKTFDGYGGLRNWAYQISCNVTPMPFFSAPTSDYCGVSSVRNLGNSVWEIEVVRSGLSLQYPEIYVFADPRGATTNPDTNYGMQVMHTDGTLSFDSRRQPLAVVGGAAVAPPTNPSAPSSGGLTARFCSSNASSNFAPGAPNNFPASFSATKPIYFYPSIAQAQREVSVSETEKDCAGPKVYGECVLFEDKYYWTSNYWCFYRGGIRATTTSISCGWVAVDYGCNYTWKEKSTFLGIGIGSDSGAGGAWPYSNETLNLQSTPVIIADGANYD